MDEMYGVRFAPVATGDATERGNKKRRTRKIAPITSNPTSNRLPNDSESPRCDINAARPSPAAMPAIGPSHRDMPDGAGAAGEAARAAAAPGCAGITGSEAAPGRGATLGAGWLGATFWRCMPRLRPPPNRLASATSAERSATAVMAPIASAKIDFM